MAEQHVKLAHEKESSPHVVFQTHLLQVMASLSSQLEPHNSILIIIRYRNLIVTKGIQCNDDLTAYAFHLMGKQLLLQT